MFQQRRRRRQEQQFLCRFPDRPFGAVILTTLRLLDTDLTPTDPGTEISGLECLRDGLFELVPPSVHGGQPEGELVGEVVTSTTPTGTFDEGRGPEVLQAGARTGQGLSSALGTRSRVLKRERYKRLI